MSENTISSYSGSSDVAIKFGRINKSPVLYLRRRRFKDYNRPFTNGASTTHKHMEPLPSSQPVWKDDGYRYPNHESKGRLGQVEWVKFRDYKKRIPVKWIRANELVID